MSRAELGEGSPSNLPQIRQASLASPLGWRSGHPKISIPGGETAKKTPPRIEPAHVSLAASWRILTPLHVGQPPPPRPQGPSPPHPPSTHPHPHSPPPPLAGGQAPPPRHTQTPTRPPLPPPPRWAGGQAEGPVPEPSQFAADSFRSGKLAGLGTPTSDLGTSQFRVLFRDGYLAILW